MLLSAMRSSGDVVRRQQLVDAACNAGHNTLIREDLRGFDLSGLSLSNTVMKDVDCSHSHCEGTKLPALEGAVFDGAVMTNVYIPHVKNSTFRGAIMTDGYLGHRIRDCCFAGANMRGVMIGIRPDEAVGCVNCDFSDADMSGLFALGSRFESAQFERSVLTGARLARSVFANCVFSQTRLDGANLARVQQDGMQGSDCQNAIVTEDGLPLVANHARRNMLSWDRQTVAQCAEELMTMVGGAGGGKVVKWTMRLDRLAENVLIANIREYIAYTHHAVTSVPLRLYYTENGSMCDALEMLICDYAGWRVDPRSVRTKYSPVMVARARESLHRLWDAVRIDVL